MNYCVYTHSIQGVIFYVGAGQMGRPYDRFRRSRAWKATAISGFDVTIIAVFQSKKEAHKREGELIKDLRPSCNGTPGRVPSLIPPQRLITFPLHLTKEEHAAIKRRADAAGLSINRYVKAMSIDGKLPKKGKP